jgi:Zn-finger nucleic acid-binding protein
MKNCPACQSATLQSTNLEAHLAASLCSSCDGHWVTVDDYHTWLGSSPQAVTTTAPADVEDSTHAIFCPACSQLMRKTNVGHDLNFYLDQCPCCHGIWFDQHEWDNLKSKNLHTQVQQMSSAAWQQKARQHRLHSTVRQAYASKFSATDYLEAERIKNWLERHPQKQDLLSFFTAPSA